ncbi:MAG: hypothetical protein WC975_11290 [Phycisphaerae bacterium]
MKSKDNAVAIMRKIRDRLSKKLKDMTFEEQKEYLKQAAKTGIKKNSKHKAHLG